MSLAQVPALPLAMAAGNRWLAQLAPSSAGLAFSGGAILMLLGLYLRWRLPEFRMTTEERTKDGRMSEDQARRRIFIYRMSAPVVVMLGAILFATLFWE